MGVGCGDWLGPNNRHLMKIKHIAEALCLGSFESCAKTIIPPWAEGADDLPSRNAWMQVQTLRRQRAELLEIWPHKKATLDEQFNDTVMVLAAEVYDALYDITA